MAKDEQGSFGAEVDEAIDRFFHENVDGDLNAYLDAQKIEHPTLTIQRRPDEDTESFKPEWIPCEPGYEPTQRLGRRPDGNTYTIYGCKWVGGL